MIVCGVKLTHDGGIALVDDNRLVFSIEIEKLDNNTRHSSLMDLGVIFDVIREHGYDPFTVDQFAFDGWRDTGKTRHWDGVSARVELAPYRRGIRTFELFHSYQFRILDFHYTSYHHYAGHVASALCTAPFTQRGEDGYILCWDGAMFPYLYHYSAAENQVRDLGPLFYMAGDTYHSMAMMYPPFTESAQWPYTLTVAGKVMAYVAHGISSPVAHKTLRSAYDRAYVEVFGDKPIPDDKVSDLAGRQMIDLMRSGLDVGQVGQVGTDDMLTSIHDFIGGFLVENLAKKVRADGHRAPNICLVGGCALNIKWNRKIRESEIFTEVWVPPFPNDAGSAIGTACCAIMRGPGPKAIDWDVYAGPAMLPAEPLDGWRSKKVSLDELAGILYRAGEPVVFLHGRAELGPRALGHRSILAPATAPEMKDRLNEIKDREPYRPVAPVCLEHRATQIFDPGTPDPYMLFDHDVREGWRDRVPAICHLDGTARIQTINSVQCPELVELLTAYERLSGIPLLCNTSANRKGRGFFPDVRSAMEWGRVPRIWSTGILYEKNSE